MNMEYQGFFHTLVTVFRWVLLTVASILTVHVVLWISTGSLGTASFSFVVGLLFAAASIVMNARRKENRQ